MVCKKDDFRMDNERFRQACERIMQDIIDDSRRVRQARDLLREAEDLINGRHR